MIELEEKPEEDDDPTPPTNEKKVLPLNDNGKANKVVTYASIQVSTRSFTKASIQRSAAPATTVVGSLTTTPSVQASNHVIAPSHSGSIILFVSRKRKAVAVDTYATSS